MEFPLDDEQRAKLDAFTAKVAGRVPARGMVELLCDLQAMRIAAGLKHSEIAERIAELAPKKLGREALPGHTRDGAFSPGNMSAELDYTTPRLPRKTVVDAMAQLYCERVVDPEHSVSLEALSAHLNALRHQALQAEHPAAGSGDEPEYVEPRVPSVAELDALRERIEHLEDDQRRDADELKRLSEDLKQLGDDLIAAREQLEAEDVRLEGLVEGSEDRRWRKELAGQAHLDRVEGQVDELRRRVERRWWQRAGQTPTGSSDDSDARPELPDQDQDQDQDATLEPAAAPEPAEDTGRVPPESQDTPSTCLPEEPESRPTGTEEDQAGNVDVSSLPRNYTDELAGLVRPSRAIARDGTSDQPSRDREAAVVDVEPTTTAGTRRSKRQSRVVVGSLLADAFLLAVFAAIPILPARTGTAFPSFASCLTRFNGNTQVVHHNSPRSLYQAAATTESDNYDILRGGQFYGTFVVYPDADTARQAFPADNSEDRIPTPSVAQIVRITSVVRLASALPASSSLFASVDVCK